MCDRKTVNLSALHLDGHGFCQLERDRCLRSEMDVLLSRKKGHCRSGSRTDRPADQRARASAGQSANHRAPSGTAADPREVAFLVVTANPRRRSGPDVVAVAIHGHGLQRKMQSRPANQSSIVVLIK